ncbi:hypothetical protein [Gordonia sp. VNK21]|uniref:hypothetical protein n=1 Tax=Gordonia sp. VNK21 TaxID=3382483 RepID=UPI0038D47045
MLVNRVTSLVAAAAAVIFFGLAVVDGSGTVGAVPGSGSIVTVAGAVGAVCAVICALTSLSLMIARRPAAAARRLFIALLAVVAVALLATVIAVGVKWTDLITLDTGGVLPLSLGALVLTGLAAVVAVWQGHPRIWSAAVVVTVAITVPLAMHTVVDHPWTADTGTGAAPSLTRLDRESRSDLQRFTVGREQSVVPGYRSLVVVDEQHLDVVDPATGRARWGLDLASLSGSETSIVLVDTLPVADLAPRLTLVRSPFVATYDLRTGDLESITHDDGQWREALREAETSVETLDRIYRADGDDVAVTDLQHRPVLQARSVCPAGPPTDLESLGDGVLIRCEDPTMIATLVPRGR